MALKGNLQDFGITQLLNLVNLARKTGSLYLESREGKCILSFREGKLIYASMDGEEESLPVLLMKAGKLTAEQVKAIQQHMAGRPDRDIAITLINSGHLKPEDIVKVVNQQTLNTVYRVFSWNDGTFRFEPTDMPPQGKMTTSIALENVIMEGSRRLKEWERLQDELPDLDASLKFAERPTTPLRDINLSPDEWRVISFVNPRNTIRQIAQSNNMSEYQIRKIVYSLLQAGIVQLVPSQRPQAATAGGPAMAGAQAAASAQPVQMRSPAVKRNVVQKLIDRIREL